MENGEFVYGPLLSDIYFGAGSKVGIGTNPAIVNIQSYDGTSHQNSPLYLHGLSVEVLDYADNGTVQIKVRLNDYDVKENVRWTGNIVMKDKVVLKNGKTIKIDQSKTPNQTHLDPVSDLFAKPTVFTCEDGSEFIMESGSNVTLKNKSTLLLESGSVFEIGNDATLTVNSGDTLKIEPGAELNIHKDGQIFIQNGGMFIINGGTIAGSGIIAVAGKVDINGNCTSEEVELYNILHGGEFVINNGGIFQLNNSNLNIDKYAEMIIKPEGKFIVNEVTIKCPQTYTPPSPPSLSEISVAGEVEIIGDCDLEYVE